MILSHNGRDYEIVFGREGGEVFLELNSRSGDERDTLLFAYRSENDSAISFTAFHEGVPFELVERFAQQVRERLGSGQNR